MATVNLGNIKLNWKGAYNSSTAYIVDDVVSYNGSSYVCIQASTNNLPTNTTYWNQMSAAGTNGTDVGTTITTQGDILFRDGSGLQRLAIGTANQILQVNSSANALEYTAKPEGNLVQHVVMNSSTGYSATNNSNYQAASAWDIAITPTNANNRLLYTFSSHGASRYSSNGTSGALLKFQSSVGGTDTDVSGSNVHLGYSNLNNVQLRGVLHRQFYMTAGTTSQITFKVLFKEVAGNTEAWFGNSVGYAGNTFVSVMELKV